VSAEAVLGGARAIYTAQQGTNADLIAAVARLYLRPGLRVADVTYGRGVFWQKVDLSQIDLLGTDLADGTDFRELPYTDQSVDVVVLDPPYMHNPGRPQVDYRNVETTRGMSHADIMLLYTEGMREAMRVLRLGGLLWVKCQDEIESGRQCWSHIEIEQDARDLGFCAVDLFVLVRPAATVQVKRQLHARKNHSYLWVFRRGR
jgi:hypothetical protein